MAPPVGFPPPFHLGEVPLECAHRTLSVPGSSGSRDGGVPPFRATSLAAFRELSNSRPSCRRLLVDRGVCPLAFSLRGARHHSIRMTALDSAHLPPRLTVASHA